MNLTSKKCAIIDLDRKTYEVRNYIDLLPYIGGVNLGLKLYKMYEEKDPLVFAVGPLNGFFPFASKTAIVLNDGGNIEDIYIGGSLSTRIRFTDIDAFVFLGKAKEKTIINITNDKLEFLDEEQDINNLGLPGKRSILSFREGKMVVDKEFTTHEYIAETKLQQKNILGIVVTGTNTYQIENFDKYRALFKQILDRSTDISFPASDKPSCAMCPVGCDKSRFGEIGGNVLVHSLVGCQLAEKIYADISLVFACFNSLGYHYTHEDLERLPSLVEETLKAIG